jgi:hypothetical protein
MYASRWTSPGKARREQQRKSGDGAEPETGRKPMHQVRRERQQVGITPRSDRMADPREHTSVHRCQGQKPCEPRRTVPDHQHAEECDGENGMEGQCTTEGRFPGNGQSDAAPADLAQGPANQSGRCEKKPGHSGYEIDRAGKPKCRLGVSMELAPGQDLRRREGHALRPWRDDVEQRRQPQHHETRRDRDSTAGHGEDQEAAVVQLSTLAFDNRHHRVHGATVKVY